MANGTKLAVGFALDRLLNETLPRFFDARIKENRAQEALDYQRQKDESIAEESARRFDAQLDAQRIRDFRTNAYRDATLEESRKTREFNQELRQTALDEETDEALLNSIKENPYYSSLLPSAEKLGAGLKTQKYKNLLNSYINTVKSNKSVSDKSLSSLSDVFGEGFREYYEARLGDRVNITDSQVSNVIQTYMSKQTNVDLAKQRDIKNIYSAISQTEKELEMYQKYSAVESAGLLGIPGYEGYEAIGAMNPKDRIEKTKSLTKQLSTYRQDFYDLIKGSGVAVNEQYNPNFTSGSTITGLGVDSPDFISRFTGSLDSQTDRAIPKLRDVDLNNLNSSNTVRIGSDTYGMNVILNDDGNLTGEVSDEDLKIIQKVLGDENFGSELYVDGLPATQEQDSQGIEQPPVPTQVSNEGAVSRLSNKYQTEDEAVNKTLLNLVTGGRISQASDIPTITEGARGAREALSTSIAGSTKEETKAVRNARYGVNQAINNIIIGQRKGITQEEINKNNEELKNLIIEASRAAISSKNPAVRNNLKSLINNTESKIRKAAERIDRSDDSVKYFFGDTLALINAMKAQLEQN